jgi:ABC-type uncharacterized transport system involved in gliding motility auxiliary subunit
MKNADLKPYAPWAGVVGLAGLLAAAVAGALYREFNVGVQAGLIIGLAGFVLAVLFDPSLVLAWLGMRQTRYGANVAVMTLALLGILILVNYLVKSNPVRWDLAEGQINTLAPESAEAIRKVPAPVKAVGFYSSDQSYSLESARKLLDRYQAEAPGKLTYEIYDPYSDIGPAKEYNVTRDGTLILEMGDQRETLNSVTETEVTSALIRFTQPAKRTLYFLSGHGELSIDDAGDSGLDRVVDLLAKQNYDVRPLDLVISGTVPADARAIVIAGPLQPFTADEMTALTSYLSTPNAAAVLLLDPTVETQDVITETEANPLVDYLAAAWGIRARNDLIVSPNQSVQGNPYWPVVVDYGSSPIANQLQRIPTIFPAARSLDIGSAPPDVTLTPLAQIEAGTGAWGEVDLAGLAEGLEPAADANDAQTPLTIGVAATNSTTQARLVVFGDASFASNRVFDPSARTASASLFVNSVNWATVDETLINLTPKTPPTRALEFVDALTMRAIQFVIIIVMPVSVLLMGGVVWFLRRRHV